MRVFTTVVDLGSQSAAADHLDLSRPVVSRYLAELEEWVGARLMHRTTRKLSLTAAGFETLPRCRQLLELADDLQATVSVPGDAPRGLLRISVSTSFGQAQLACAVTDYVRLGQRKLLRRGAAICRLRPIRSFRWPTCAKSSAV